MQFIKIIKFIFFITFSLQSFVEKSLDQYKVRFFASVGFVYQWLLSSAIVTGRVVNTFNNGN